MQTYCQTGRDGNGRQRRQQRAQSREQILDAAVQAFARFGFEATSMADIAASAGLKKALVQYHFETKENLWRKAMAHLWHLRDEVLPRYLDDATLAGDRASLREVLSAILKFNQHHPEWIALVFRESATPGPRLSWLIEHYLRDDIRNGTEFIERAQKAGLLPDVSPLQLLHLISAALSYNLLVAPMTAQAVGVDLTTAEAMDEQVDILMDLLHPARGVC